MKKKRRKEISNSGSAARHLYLLLLVGARGSMVSARLQIFNIAGANPLASGA
jgi:hypothetical protein